MHCDRSNEFVRYTGSSVMDDVLRPRDRPAVVLPQSSSSPSPAPRPAAIEWMSGGVIAALVLGSLCLVLGIVYAYIYFTRINPRAGRGAAGGGRSARKSQSLTGDDGVAVGVSTHLFLFKKSWVTKTLRQHVIPLATNVEVEVCMWHNFVLSNSKWDAKPHTISTCERLRIIEQKWLSFVQFRFNGCFVSCWPRCMTHA